MVEIGKQIKYLRQQQEMTQKQLASHLNVAHNTVSQYEKGVTAPPLDVVVRLAKLFDVSADSLLGISEERDLVEKKFTEQEKILVELNEAELRATTLYMRKLLTAREVLPMSPIQRLWKELDWMQRNELMEFAEGMLM